MKDGRRLILAAVAFAALTRPSSADILIEDVALIVGDGAAAREHMHVLIEGDHIAAVSERAIDAPQSVQRLSGAGKFLMPGLIDTHVHLRGAADPSKKSAKADIRAARQALASYLYSGVTSIYDAGNDPDLIFSLREKERSGALASPRIFATGGIVTYPGSHGASPYATLVDDWPSAKPLVEAHAARNPDLVKFTLEERGWGARPLIPLLPLDLLQRLVEFYNDRGVRTTVHTSSELRAREAIFAGVDTLAHPVIQGPISDEFARLMGARKIPMASTLTIGENYSRLAEHPDYLDQPLYRAAFSADEIEKLKTETRKDYQDRSWTWWMKIMTPIAQENLRKIDAAGGVIALGTDQSNGPAVHREMELLAAAGIAPASIIKIATRNAALFLGKEDELGLVRVGYKADLVLLNADPTLDIDNAKNIAAVIKAGDLIDRRRLDLAGVASD